MYESPKLEKFGTLRQLIMAPLYSAGASFAMTNASLAAVSGNCGPNIPLGDPSACGRS